MHVEITVQFKTAHPLRQEDGMKFWTRGQFKSLPGKAAYQLTARG